jgi:exonuclease III
MASIIQWNIRGYRASYSELRHLLIDTAAVCTCLQEVLFSLKIPDALRGYTMYYVRGSQDPVDNSFRGDVATLIMNSIAHSRIDNIFFINARLCFSPNKWACNSCNYLKIGEYIDVNLHCL